MHREDVSIYNACPNVPLIKIQMDVVFFKCLFSKIIKRENNYSFGPFICHEISLWSSSFLLSQFGPYFLKNDSIWSSPLTLTKRC